MSDFDLVVSKLFELLSIEVPIFGFRFTLLSIFVSFSILSIVIGFVVKIFGGEK